MRRLWCDVSGRQTRHLQELGATLPGFLSISSYGREVLKGLVHFCSAIGTPHRLYSPAIGSSSHFLRIFSRISRSFLPTEEGSPEAREDFEDLRRARSGIELDLRRPSSTWR